MSEKNIFQFLNHRFHSLAYLKRFMGEKNITCMALHSYSGLFSFINSNIINKFINISLIILSAFIINEFGPPMSLF